MNLLLIIGLISIIIFVIYIIYYNNHKVKRIIQIGDLQEYIINNHIEQFYDIPSFAQLLDDESYPLDVEYWSNYCKELALFKENYK